MIGLPKICSDYPSVVKNFIIDKYLPYNKLCFYINNNLFDNLWEDFKDDDNLFPFLLCLRGLINKHKIEIPESFNTDSSWLKRVGYKLPITIKDRSSYLTYRRLIPKEYGIQ